MKQFFCTTPCIHYIRMNSDPRQIGWLWLDRMLKWVGYDEYYVTDDYGNLVEVSA